MNDGFCIQLKISQICSRLKVEGLRGDIVTSRAAKAAVALDGRSEVAVDDIERVIGLCLNHRMRKDPLDPIDTGKATTHTLLRITAASRIQSQDRLQEDDRSQIQRT